MSAFLRDARPLYTLFRNFNQNYATESTRATLSPSSWHQIRFAQNLGEGKVFLHPVQDRHVYAVGGNHSHLNRNDMVVHTGHGVGSGECLETGHRPLAVGSFSRFTSFGGFKLGNRPTRRAWGPDLNPGAPMETEQLVGHDPTAQGPSMEKNVWSM